MWSMVVVWVVVMMTVVVVVWVVVGWEVVMVMRAEHRWVSTGCPFPPPRAGSLGQEGTWLK
jgi:heme/copper-type cytochrome/quinol oxidase subunit 2